MIPAAQTTPVQGWVVGSVEFLQQALPAIFLTVVALVCCLMIFMRRGHWPRKTLLFGIGAALVYLLLTNVANVADLFRAELPLD